MDSAVLIFLSLVPQVGLLMCPETVSKAAVCPFWPVLACGLLPRWLPTLEELGCCEFFPIFNPLLCSSPPPFFKWEGRIFLQAPRRTHPLWFSEKKVMITADRGELFLHNCQKSLPRKIYLSNFLFGSFQAQLNSPLQILSRSSNPKAATSNRICSLLCVLGISSPNRTLMDRCTHRGRGMGRGFLLEFVHMAM